MGFASSVQSARNEKRLRKSFLGGKGEILKENKKDERIRRRKLERSKRSEVN